MALSDRLGVRPLGDLHPDVRNPRLAGDGQRWAVEDDLLTHLADSYDALSIAESIARHGYFASEPLVVTEEGNALVVLEGNRRLAALIGLARPDLRARFRDSQRWDAAASKSRVTLDSVVPILFADERRDADALIGYRHITGVQEWKPLQRARFIAHLVDERDQPFLEVAQTVGEDEGIVRMLYRNQALLSDARRADVPEVASGGERLFGVFTAALNYTSLRDFVGARSPSYVREREQQLSQAHLRAFIELSSWLFDGEDGKRVIGESRDLGRLAEVVRSEAALAELRRTRSLDAAYALTSGPPKRLMRQFAIALGHLRAVANSVDVVRDHAEFPELLDEVEAVVRVLRAVQRPDDL